MTEQVCVVCNKTKKSHADADTKFNCIVAYMKKLHVGGVMTA